MKERVTRLLLKTLSYLPFSSVLPLTSAHFYPPSWKDFHFFFLIHPPDSPPPHLLLFASLIGNINLVRGE